jgi:hypothetical protein
MTRGRSFLPVLPALLLLGLLGCSLPSALMPTPTAVPILPRPGPTAYGGILITGSPEFVEQTRQALSLLEAEAPAAYAKVQAYVGIIAQGEHSGMWAWEEPPRYEVGDATAFYSVTWYASTVAHDALHSELYHTGQEWEGVDVENFCNGYQLTVLEQIGAPQNEIDYLAGLDGTHCDVDEDGDCDWSDYEDRDW